MYCPFSSTRKALYDPRAFFLHAALLRQTFVHCAKFPTAASRRSLGRVSVPVWLIILSDQLMIVALVSHYLTNKLIMRRPFPNRRSFTPWSTCGISYSFEQLSLSLGYVPTCYSPVRRSCILTPYSNFFKYRVRTLPLDLHVLGTPPAFILSQDQTLQKRICSLCSVKLQSYNRNTDLKTISVNPDKSGLPTFVGTDVDLHYSIFNVQRECPRMPFQGHLNRTSKH